MPVLTVTEVQVPVAERVGCLFDLPLPAYMYGSQFDL